MNQTKPETFLRCALHGQAYWIEDDYLQACPLSHSGEILWDQAGEIQMSNIDDDDRFDELATIIDALQMIQQ